MAQVSPSAAPAGDVDLASPAASTEVQGVAAWVNASHDAHGMPYAIVDKANARVFVFDARGRLLGADAALLGITRGDRSAEGVGRRALSTIPVADRTTPAGRFKASLERDMHGKEVLVIDYAAAISLHAVVKGTPREHRAERLASATSDDNRISFGCINVPAKFFATVVNPTFTHTYGMVYILPETRHASEFFGFRGATLH